MSSSAFDASTLEVWAPLLNGGCCVVRKEALPSLDGLATLLLSSRVTDMWITSALRNTLVEDRVDALPMCQDSQRPSNKLLHHAVHAALREGSGRAVSAQVHLVRADQTVRDVGLIWSRSTNNFRRKPLGIIAVHPISGRHSELLGVYAEEIALLIASNARRNLKRERGSEGSSAQRVKEAKALCYLGLERHSIITFVPVLPVGPARPILALVR
jgi:hypothetical protein